MKEVQVIAWCSNQIVHGDDPRAARATTEVTLSVDGSKPHVLDLCDDCDGTLGSTLRTAAAMGEKVGAVKVRRAPRAQPEVTDRSHVCPVCEHPFAQRKTMTTHLRKVHSQSIKDLRST